MGSIVPAGNCHCYLSVVATGGFSSSEENRKKDEVFICIDVHICIHMFVFFFQATWPFCGADIPSSVCFHSTGTS